MSGNRHNVSCNVRSNQLELPTASCPYICPYSDPVYLLPWFDPLLLKCYSSWANTACFYSSTTRPEPDARTLTCKCPSSPSSFMQADGLPYSSMVSVHQPRNDSRSERIPNFSSWERTSTHRRRWFHAFPFHLQEYTKCYNVLRECVPHAPVQNAPNNPETMSESPPSLIPLRPASYCHNRMTDQRDPNLPQDK